MIMEDKKTIDERHLTELSLESFVSQSSICGIPADGIQSVYWGNDLVWEKPQN